MLRGAVVNGKVKDHPDAQLVGSGKKCPEIIQRAVLGIHIIIVCHIIFVIGRRRHNGHQPDAVYAERGNIGKLIFHAAKIADAIPVAVAVGTHKDLIPVGAVGTGRRCRKRKDQDQYQQCREKPLKGFHFHPPCFQGIDMI